MCFNYSISASITWATCQCRCVADPLLPSRAASRERIFHHQPQPKQNSTSRSIDLTNMSLFKPTQVTHTQSASSSVDDMGSSAVGFARTKEMISLDYSLGLICNKLEFHFVTGGTAAAVTCISLWDRIPTALPTLKRQVSISLLRAPRAGSRRLHHGHLSVSDRRAFREWGTAFCTACVMFGWDIPNAHRI